MEVNISNRGTLFLLDYYINIIGLVFIDAIGFLQRLIAKTNEFGSIDVQCIYDSLSWFLQIHFYSSCIGLLSNDH